MRDVSIFFMLFAYMLRRKAHINFTLPPANEPLQPLYLVNYRGQYIAATSDDAAPTRDLFFRHDSIIHFSSPLKSHRSEKPDITLMDRRIGAPVKLISDVLLRDHTAHPNFIGQNYKSQQLKQLGVDRILV